MRDTFIDPRDHNSYEIVKLRDGKWWFAENFRADITGSFPADENPRDEVLATNPEYDWKKYGRLYVWDVARKAAPPGWHLSSDSEWKKMLKLYGGYSEFYGSRPVRRGRYDVLTLIRDELNVQFGGCLEASDHYLRNPQGPFGYIYFGGFMGGRFWTSSRPFWDRISSVWGRIKNPSRIDSALYFLLFNGMGEAQRSQEIKIKAFSVRYIKD